MHAHSGKRVASVPRTPTSRPEPISPDAEAAHLIFLLARHFSFFVAQPFLAVRLFNPASPPCSRFCSGEFISPSLFLRSGTIHRAFLRLASFCSGRAYPARHFERSGPTFLPHSVQRMRRPAQREISLRFRHPGG